MNQLNKTSKVTRLVVLLFICSIILSSFIFTGCQRQDFSGTYDTNIAANNRTYPFDETGTTIKSVGLDIVYGTKKSLVQYHGEIPYLETHNKDTEERLKEFNNNNWPVVKGTTLFGNNNVYGRSVPVAQYWGKVSFTKDKDGHIKRADLEKEIYKTSDIKSLRLYALHITYDDFFLFIGNALYLIFSTICQLAMMILSLIVAAKNIDATAILRAMKLEEASKIITKAFIWNPETKTLSAFAVICIILFISTIVGFVISYVKGTQQKITKRDIAVYALVGLLLVGAALSGRLNSIGSILSNTVSQMLYTVASASSGSQGAFFTTVDKTNQNRLLQVQEMSLVNKAYIDIQLCTQFKVGSVKDLDMEYLGDTSYFYATRTLQGINGNTNLKEEFDGNLGYYFWFANSGAVSKTKNNTTLPKTNPVSAKEKISSTINWLQTMYTIGDDTHKARILNLMDGLASPDTMSGFARMLILGWVIIIMCLCLWRYAKDVLFAKIQMMVALLGLAVAGPLMITGKKKLVATAKDLVALIFISFIEITVYSLMFDAILYLVSALLGPNFIEMVVPLILLILLLKFNKKLNEKIHEFTSQMESSMLSSNGMVYQAKRGISNWYDAKHSKLTEGASNLWNNKLQKNVYDDEGNFVGKTSMFGGTVLGTIGNIAINSAKKSSESESLAKIGSEAFKAKHDNANAVKDMRLKYAKEQADKIKKTIDTEASLENSKMTAGINSAIAAITNNAKDRTNKELSLMAQIATASATLKTKTSAVEQFDKRYGADYRKIEERIANGTATNSDLARKASFESARKALWNAKVDAENENKKLTADLNESIRQRATNKYYSDEGVDMHTQDLINKYGQKDGLKINAQQKHKAEYEKALNAVVDEANRRMNSKEYKRTKGVNDKVNGKQKRHSDKEAMNEANAAMLQMAELNNDLTVSDTDKALELTAAAADVVAKSEDFSLNNDAAFSAATQQVHSAKGHRDPKDIFGIHQTNAIIGGTVKQGVHAGKATAKETGAAFMRGARNLKNHNHTADINTAVGQAQVRQIINERQAGVDIKDIKGLDTKTLQSKTSDARRKSNENLKKSGV